MARPTPQEIEDLRKQAAIDAAYAKSMRNTEEAPMPARPASAPMAPKKYAKGGSVNASKRADGCATKGKTRGKFV